MTVVRYRPQLQNTNGQGHCQVCGTPATILTPVVRDGTEHLFCKKCLKKGVEL